MGTRASLLIDAGHLQEWVKDSAILEPLALLALKSIDDKHEIAKLLNWKAYSGSPGWYVCGIDPITGQYRDSGQFKPDKAIVFPDHDKPQKYFTFPKGRDSEVFFVAVNRQAWENVAKRYNVPILESDIDETRDDLGFWQWVINHPELPLVPTEGIKKGYCLLSCGYIPLVLPGVWNGQRKKKLHPDLVPFVVSGRSVILSFDADVAIKEEVRDALKFFGTLARKRGAIVEIAEWDLELGKGVDDVVVQNGVEKLHAIMENATPYSEWLKGLEEQFGDSSAGNAEGKKKKSKPPSAHAIAKKLLGKYRVNLAWNIQIQSWMRYEAETVGVWSVEHDAAIEGAIKAELDCMACFKDGYSHNYLKEVIKFLRCDLLVRKWDEQPGLLPLTDGVLELRTMKLLPHAPGYRLTWCLPYGWKERSIGCQPIQDWLLEVAKGDTQIVQLLRAFLKAAVCSRTDLHVYLEAIGPGGTGKSTLMNLASKLVGELNTYATTLKQLEENRFEGAAIFGKKLLLITDSERYGGEVSQLKAITGGDPIRYERKNVQQGTNFSSFIPKCMVIVAANEMVQSSDYTSGLERRRRTVPFTHQIHPSQRRDLAAEFQSYLAGLLEWALQMSDEEMRQLLVNTNESVKSLQRWKAESLLDINPLAEWLDFHVVHDLKAKTYVGIAVRDKSPDSTYHFRGVTEFLYASYCERAAATGAKAVSLRRFSSLLHDLCVSQLKLPGIKKGRDRKGSYFEGLAIRTAVNAEYPCPITGNIPPDDDPPPNGGNNGNNPPPPPPTPPDVTDKLMDVTDSVTAGTLGSDGCDGCDGYFQTQEASENNSVEIQREETVTSAEVKVYPSHSSQSITTLTESVSQPTQPPITTHHHPSQGRLKGAPYPGLNGYGQTKEPQQIATALRAISSQADHQQLINKYGRDRVAWVWINLLSKLDRQQLKPIITGQIAQLELISEASPTPTNHPHQQSDHKGQLKIGDRVRVNLPNHKPHGLEGVVVEVQQHDDFPYLINLEVPPDLQWLSEYRAKEDWLELIT